MPQLSEPCLIKWLREDVRKLHLGTYIREVNISTTYMFSDEVVADLNMLGLHVLHGIVGNLDSTLIVTKERHLVACDPIVLECLLHP